MKEGVWLTCLITILFLWMVWSVLRAADRRQRHEAFKGPAAAAKSDAAWTSRKPLSVCQFGAFRMRDEPMCMIPVTYHGDTASPR
jgi:cbb3-type cytochrome oxidase subunit 3